MNSSTAGIVRSDAERGRLADGQRREHRPACRRKQRDDAAVRMTDEMIARRAARAATSSACSSKSIRSSGGPGG